VGVVVDTHSAVWYLLASNSLSGEALRALEAATQAGDPVYLPSISVVEVIYLVEKGRLPQLALERLNDALADSESAFVLAPLDLTVAHSVQRVPRDTIPDMPDRIIVATALQLSLPLITCDRRTQSLGVETIW